MSQLALASAAEVSTRHLSYVETGRSRPSAELLLHLAETLDVPLRARNQLLLAAGHAPRYQQLALDDPDMSPVSDVLATILARSDPNPTVVIDQQWNLVAANAAALWLCQGVDPVLLEPPANVALLSLDPAGLAPSILNFDEYAGHLLARVRRAASSARSPELSALAAELEAVVPPHIQRHERTTVFALPMEVRVAGRELRLFSTVATFGTAVEITLAELAIETFYPVDDATAAVLESRPWVESP
jgi:transcriptional regulator with XRE-family HTH domain